MSRPENKSVPFFCLFFLSNKAVMFFSTYEVLPDGARRFITTIPKGMTKQ
jgi:hypothetical protein